MNDEKKKGKVKVSPDVCLSCIHGLDPRIVKVRCSKKDIYVMYDEDNKWECHEYCKKTDEDTDELKRVVDKYE